MISTTVKIQVDDSEQDVKLELLDGRMIIIQWRDYGDGQSIDLILPHKCCVAAFCDDELNMIAEHSNVNQLTIFP